MRSVNHLKTIVTQSFSSKFVFDIESDGLLDEATKVHVFAFTEAFHGGEVFVILGEDISLIEELFDLSDAMIAHNCVGYDLPLLEKLYGIKYDKEVIDTLGLSYYLWCDQAKHGLEYWGRFFGKEKPEVEDWENSSIEVYIDRVVSDVKINQMLFKRQVDYLAKIYSDGGNVDRAIRYVTFKMRCLMLQEKTPFVLDVERAKALLEEWTKIRDEKVESLKKVMPTVIKTRPKSKPKSMTKKDGSLSHYGEEWISLLQERGLPADHEETIQVFLREEEPNPNSGPQVKGWLYSLGWEPCTFEHKRDKSTNKVRKIEQIRDEGELVPSVKKLIHKEPAIKELEDLTVITHRIGFVEAMLDSVDSEGRITAGAHGLTNTLRFRHSRPLTNIPSKKRPYGEEIRSLLLAPEGKVLIGSDVSGLEDTSKLNLIYEKDREYVEAQMGEGYDAHLEMAKAAGYVTQDEIDFYKWYKEKNAL